MEKLNIFNFYVLNSFKFIVAAIFLDLMLDVRLFFLLKNIYGGISAPNYY